MTTAIALKKRLSDIITEYDHKKDQLKEQLQSYEDACESIKSAACVNGVWGQVSINTGSIHLTTLQSALLKSAWYSLYNDFNFKVLMTAKDKKIFEQSMSDPAEFTFENIQATFGDYILDPLGNVLRGLAEVFSGLDQSFKSHERVKIGVDGLPKRIIVSGFGGYSSYGWEKLRDVVNALASYRGESLVTNWDLKMDFEKDNSSIFKKRGLSLKIFKNGNAHLFFDKHTLKDINRALASYYGEVLADSYTGKPDERQQSSEVSKDLQYYPTPVDLVDYVLQDVYFDENELVLEPSCGCGRIMDGIKRRKPSTIVHGIEFHPIRAEEARQKGHRVLTANFLETEPTPKYDRVVMNPPFYGTHYAKHIEHAMKFLNDGGVLTAILPITAKTDHGMIEKMGYKHRWSDLPIGSFRESGTNINTTVLTMRK